MKKTIEMILSTVTEYTQKPAVTCTDALRKLITEGWFNSPRTLPEVHTKMVERGFLYSRGVVGHSLLELAKENSLKREGQPRRYRYCRE